MLKKINWGFSAKDIVYLVIVGALCFFGYRVYKDLKAEVRKSNIAYKQLSDTLVRAHNELVTRTELREFAKLTSIDLKAIEKDLKRVGADLEAVGVTVAVIKGQTYQDQGSDNSVQHEPPEQPETCNLCDIYEYTASVQQKDIKLGSIPVSRVEFDASKSKPWTVVNDDIDVEVTTVLGDGGNNDIDVFYHEIALVNKSRPDLVGERFKLKVTSSEFKQTLSSVKEFYWWSPHLSLSLDNSFMLDSGDDYYRFGGSLGFSVMGYGLTKDDQDWRFIHLGLGINSQENPYITLEPVKYNIGKFIPLISDMWVGVGVVYDQSWGINLSIGTTL